MITCLTLTPSASHRYQNSLFHFYKINLCWQHYDLSSDGFVNSNIYLPSGFNPLAFSTDILLKKEKGGRVLMVMGIDRILCPFCMHPSKCVAAFHRKPVLCLSMPSLNKLELGP